MRYGDVTLQRLFKTASDNRSAATAGAGAVRWYGDHLQVAIPFGDTFAWRPICSNASNWAWYQGSDFVSSQPFTTRTSGTQSSVAVTNSLGDSTQKSAGILSLWPGNTATGSAGIFPVASGTTTGDVFAGQGDLFCRALVSMSALSNSSQRFRTRIGYNDAFTGDGNDGIYFRQVDDVNSGNWQCVTRSGGVESVTNTSVAPVASTASKGQLLEIWTQAGGARADFWIDGVKQTGITTNLPLTLSDANATCVCATVIKSVGTTGQGPLFDLLEYWQIFDASRRS